MFFKNIFKLSLNLILISILFIGGILNFSSLAQASCPACPQFNCDPADLELLVLKNRTQAGDWQDPISGDCGDRVAFQVYYHNCVDGSVAHNTKIRIDYPDFRSTNIVSTAYLWADDASYVSDTGTINVSPAARLIFENTAKWYPNQTTSNPTILSVTQHYRSVEVNIGDIAGGWPFQGYVVFEATLTDCQNNPPLANAGPDKEVWEEHSVVLNGSGSDPDGHSLTYHWSCSGGYLSNPNIAQPTYTAYSVNNDTYYTCTLTVTDSQGLSGSDTMRILVRNQVNPTLSVYLTAIPSSGRAPLNNVDLKATVSGTAAGLITYWLDCTNDGDWEKIRSNTSLNPYTAYDLCDYSSAGTYTARVKVEREGLVAYDYTNIYVSSAPQGEISLSKMVRNLSDGTGWGKRVEAEPTELLSFLIKVRAENSSVEEVIVRDTLPSRISYQADLKIDGFSSSGNIISGLNLGDLSVGEEKEITFKAMVASADNFSYGTTELLNSVVAYNNQLSVSDTAEIRVTRKEVAGVTTVRTGVLDSFSLYLSVIFFLLFILYLIFARLSYFQNRIGEKFSRFKSFIGSGLK